MKRLSFFVYLKQDPNIKKKKNTPSQLRFYTAIHRYEREGQVYSSPVDHGFFPSYIGRLNIETDFFSPEREKNSNSPTPQELYITTPASAFHQNLKC